MGGGVRCGVIRMSSSPRIRASRAGKPAPNRAARGALGRSSRSLSRFRPARRRALSSGCDISRAATGRRRRLSRAACAVKILAGPKRARARAAWGVSARAARICRPMRRARPSTASTRPASPPNRWAQPVMSSTRPWGGSRAIIGVKRSKSSSTRASRAASASGRWGRVRKLGTRARASARVRPGERPALAAAGSTAARRRAPLTFSTRTMGRTTGVSCDCPVSGDTSWPEVSRAAAWRRRRSVGSQGNQIAR